MKESLNAIIDNVWAYTFMEKSLKQKGKNPDKVISVTEHRGSILKNSGIKNDWIFTNDKGKHYSVAKNPGEVKGKIVWFNEPNLKDGILAFAGDEIDRLEEDIQKEERRKLRIRSLFAYAEHVSEDDKIASKFNYSALDKASYDK